MKIPIVTIIGKPNVGKSTFFNRLAGVSIAITSQEAGTTRDRIFFKVVHPDMDFFLVDTGGLEFGKTEGNIEADIQKQTRVAIEESDLVLFMVNGREEFTDSDYRAAELLRAGSKKPVILVASKCDRALDEAELAPLYALGLGDPNPLSALHNTGVDSLLKSIIKTLKERHFLTKDSAAYQSAVRFDETHIGIALVGKTNVGKSSLINALANQEKLIVSDVPGTTRDSTDTVIRHEKKEYNFIDTAGLRRRGKIGRGIEHFSALRTLSSIERCDVTLLVIDSSKPISHQDQQIANTILKANKGLILLANKWDIKGENEEKEEQRRAAYLHRLQGKFPFLSWAPVIFTSAVTKKNLSKIFEQIDGIVREREKRVSTGALNAFVQEVAERHKPSGAKAIPPKLFYATQVGVKPPHFVFFVNKKKYFHFSYLRYLENRLRETFGFSGTPVVMEYREKERRYGKRG